MSFLHCRLLFGGSAKAMVSAAVCLLAALAAAPQARASHVVPSNADQMTVSFVQNYRQTISNAQCTARGGTPALHGGTVSLPSCRFPEHGPGTVAMLGPNSNSDASLTVVPGDINITAIFDHVICLVGGPPGCSAAGAPYDPNPSTVNPDDISLRWRWRLSDHYNCVPQSPCGTPAQIATVIDLDFIVPIDCNPTGVPASVCSVTTSANAVIPFAILPGKDMLSQVFRLRARDSGVNGTFGDADDRDFAMQGLFNP